MDPSTADVLQLLQDWYTHQCNGDWEHGYGVEIRTLDNPGWRLRINLAETDFDGVKMAERIVDRSEHDWCHCSIKDRTFDGFGGPGNLAELISVFRSVIEQSGISISTDELEERRRLWDRPEE